MCFDFLYNFCLKHFLFWADLREVLSQMYIGIHVKYSLFLPDFNESRIISRDFRKVLKYNISWKSVQWQPSCSMRKYGQTDMTKLLVAFRNFANAPYYITVLNTLQIFYWARGGAVGLGTALQAGRSRVRLPMVPLEFFIDIILPIALWPWGWLSL